MTKKHPPCPVYHPVSPEVNKGFAPIFGVDDEHGGDRLDGANERERAPMIPEEEVDHGVKVVEVDPKKGQIDSEVEMRKLHVGARPIQPTKAEVDAHFPLYLEYMSWCSHCRAGKDCIAPHRSEHADGENEAALRRHIPRQPSSWRHSQCAPLMHSAITPPRCGRAAAPEVVALGRSARKQ